LVEAGRDRKERRGALEAEQPREQAAADRPLEQQQLRRGGRGRAVRGPASGRGGPASGSVTPLSDEVLEREPVERADAEPHLPRAAPRPRAVARADRRARLLSFFTSPPLPSTFE